MRVQLDDETRNLLKEANSDKWFKKDALFSTLVGAAIAILGGLIATYWAHQLQAAHKKQQDREFADNVLRAIRFELEALMQVYDQGIGAHLNQVPEGQFLKWRLALSEDWFTVFNANAVHLGNIEGDLSRRIVVIHLMIKKVVEEFRINNKYLTELERLSEEALHKPGDGSIPGKLQFLHGLLVREVSQIKEPAKVLRAATEELFTLLDQRGIK
jgi:hypothetical protein